MLVALRFLLLDAEKKKLLTGVIDLLAFLDIPGRSATVSLPVLAVGEPVLLPLIIVFGVVVEFESDSFSALPHSSLSFIICRN